jgi:hypothetical protein
MSTSAAALTKMDIIIGLLREIVEKQTEQNTAWSLPLVSHTGTASQYNGLGFRTRDDLVGKLEDIREAVDVGRRTEALVLIDGWIGAIKTAERDSAW